MAIAIEFTSIFFYLIFFVLCKADGGIHIFVKLKYQFSSTKLLTSIDRTEVLTFNDRYSLDGQLFPAKHNFTFM